MTLSDKFKTIDDLFVCVGAQKSGTTWLARILASHPDVFVTPVKEIHYFDHIAGITAHLSDQKRRSRYRKYLQRMATQWQHFADHRAHWDWYRRYMKRPINDRWYGSLFDTRYDKRIAGEATPEYALIREAGFLHLRKLAPTVRILFIMRNPVAQAWSQVLHHCRSERIDAAGLDASDLIHLASGPRFSALSDYGTTLRDLDTVFDRAQICPMFYEDIHSDRRQSLEQITAFIGARSDGKWLPEVDRKYNRSQDVAAPDAVRAHLRVRLRETAEEVAQRVGRLPAAWSREFEL